MDDDLDHDDDDDFLGGWLSYGQPETIFLQGTSVRKSYHWDLKLQSTEAQHSFLPLLNLGGVSRFLNLDKKGGHEKIAQK